MIAALNLLVGNMKVRNRRILEHLPPFLLSKKRSEFMNLDDDSRFLLENVAIQSATRVKTTFGRAQKKVAYFWTF